MFFVFPPNFIHFILFLCIYALFIFVNQSNRNAIVIGPAWSYYIENITEKFSVDCCNHHMAGINNITRIKKYGDIKEIKRA